MCCVLRRHDGLLAADAAPGKAGRDGVTGPGPGAGERPGEGTCEAGGAEEDALRPRWGGGGLGPGGERGGGRGGRRNV